RWFGNGRHREGDFHGPAFIQDHLVHAETVRQFVGEDHALKTSRCNRSARIGGIALARLESSSKTRIALALHLAQSRRAIITGVYRLLLEFTPTHIGILRCLLIDVVEYRFSHCPVSGAKLGDGELLCGT